MEGSYWYMLRSIQWHPFLVRRITSWKKLCQQWKRQETVCGNWKQWDHVALTLWMFLFFLVAEYIWFRYGMIHMIRCVSVSMLFSCMIIRQTCALVGFDILVVMRSRLNRYHGQLFETGSLPHWAWPQFELPKQNGSCWALLSFHLAIAERIATARKGTDMWLWDGCKYLLAK